MSDRIEHASHRRPGEPSRRRVVLMALVLALSALGGCTLEDEGFPTCTNLDVMILVAQSVPSATILPCVERFPAGWSLGGLNIKTDLTQFWLNSDRGGYQAVTVMLTPTCDTSGAVEVQAAPDELGTRRFEAPEVLPPRFIGNRYYLFPGGCVTYRFTLAPGSSYAQIVEGTEAVGFQARTELAEAVGREGLRLCGAGVDCPG